MSPKKRILSAVMIACFAPFQEGAVAEQEYTETRAHASKSLIEWVERVEVYGKLQLSAELLDDGTDTSAFVSSNSSRIGFKGVNELTESLSAVWQYEGGVTVNNVEGSFETRNSFVGISSSAGLIFLGRHDTPFERLSRDMDIFDERIGDSRNIIGLGGPTDFNLRADNIIAYKSPDIAGFRTFLLYKTEDGEDSDDLIGASVRYENGDFWTGIGYEYHGEVLTRGSTPSVGAASNESEQGVRVVGNYTWDGFRVVGLFESLYDVGGVSGADRLAWGGGIAYSFGKYTVKGSYYGTDGIDGVSSTGANMYALALDYDFTQRATVYIAGATTINDESSDLTMTGAGHGADVFPEADDDPYGVAVGVNITF
ncbi:MAG: porin [Gammaproteobacteria bacterium]|nr:porin [Gammaproteobacteria bacterium]